MKTARYTLTPIPAKTAPPPELQSRLLNLQKDESGMRVTLSGDARGSVYYTLDGSMPTPSNAKKYTGAFYVPGGTVIRAVSVVKWNGIRSDETSMTVTARGNLFADVKPGDWFYNDVDRVAAEGILNGTAKNVFSPNVGLTRAMLATALYRAAGQPEVSGELDFSDASEVGSWCRDALLWACENGIMRGYEDGALRPGRSISRAELGCMMTRYLVLSGKDISELEDVLSGFSDAGAVNESMRTELNAACALGIVKGVGGGLLLTGQRRDPRSGGGHDMPHARYCCMKNDPLCRKLHRGSAFVYIRARFLRTPFQMPQRGALSSAQARDFSFCPHIRLYSRISQADHDLFSLYNGLFRQAALENPPIMLLTKLYLHSIIMCKFDSFINQL